MLKGAAPVRCGGLIRSRPVFPCLLYVIHIDYGMEFEFDPAKVEANLFKHRVRLAFGRRVFDDPDHIISSSIRLVDGEDRNKAVGMIEGKLYTAIHVWRGEAIRMISVRRSNAGEQRDYHSNPG